MTWEPKVELNLGGWTDVTSLVYARDRIQITRGRRSEGSTADAAACNLTLNNRSGDLTPRNPTGTYYGLLGRNTPMRVSLPATESHLQVPGTGADGATCPDHARLDITGDIDVRVELWAASWRDGTDLAGKYTTTGNQRSWAFWLNAAGTLSFRWSTDGTTYTDVTSTAVVPLPIVGRRAVRFTLDVNNGAGGYTVRFYTSDSLDGTWTELGDATATTSGTTSIYASTAIAYVGYHSVVSVSRWYRAEVRSGIGGTVAAAPDFRALSDGATTTTDSAGNLWTVAGDAEVVARQWLFHGEVPEWPARRDLSGRDVHVPVAAAGIMRRLGKGARPLRSAYFRGCTSTVAPIQNLVGYWPMEDAVGSVGMAAGLPGGLPMAVVGRPELAKDSTSFACSAALPDAGTAQFTGTVRSHTATGEVQVRMLLAVPEAGATNGAVLLSVRCTGSAARWDIIYGTGGTLTLTVYSSAGASLDTTGAVAFSLDGHPVRLHLSLQQNGADIDWKLGALAPGADSGGSLSSTLASATVGVCTSVCIAPQYNATGCTVGHVTVQSVTTSSLWDFADLLHAHTGETACARVARLCSEESIACQVLGASSGSVLMGAQRQDTLLALLRECEATEGGILYEPRDFLGIAYRGVRGLYNQDALVEFDYAAGDLSAYDPVEDDQSLANAVTASRTGGSSARYELTTGPMSTAAPPNGVGLYETSISVNVAGDDMLEAAASSAVSVGTVNEPRYPGLNVQLARAGYVADAALTRAVAGLDPGDRISVLNPPDGIADDASQLVVGTIETLDRHSRELQLVCTPESPYRVLVWGDSTARWAAAGAVLAEDLTTTETGVDVDPGGALFSHDDGDFDVLIGGERMTVTAVSGTSTQTLTVTRSVNGVVKTHSTGAAVQLADVRRWAR